MISSMPYIASMKALGHYRLSSPFTERSSILNEIAAWVACWNPTVLSWSRIICFKWVRVYTVDIGGLNIYPCRFVELLGGKIWAQSELGKGSTFCFWLPLSLSSARGSFGESSSNSVSGLWLIYQLVSSCLEIGMDQKRPRAQGWKQVSWSGCGLRTMLFDVLHDLLVCKAGSKQCKMQLNMWCHFSILHCWLAVP